MQTQTICHTQDRNNSAKSQRPYKNPHLEHSEWYVNLKSTVKCSIEYNKVKSEP
jgi:hypothetical protein